MDRGIKNSARAFMLLGLFAFAHISQALHQNNNPQEAPVDCSMVEYHYHHHVPDHSCEICDFQLTYWSHPLVIFQQRQPFTDILTDFFPPPIPTEKFHRFSHRGPPIA